MVKHLDVVDQIVTLCHTYTHLMDEEIEELLKVARQIESGALAPDSDIFIDVFNEVNRNALVVYHRLPLSKKSLYNSNVVGLDALLENEPGVLRTMQLGINSIGLIALSQEGKRIRQSIYPIKCLSKTIGTLIIETDGTSSADNGEVEVKELIGYVDIADEFLVNQLSENVLVFNEKGFLIKANEESKQLYKRLGYRDSIIGLFYDNLILDYMTFDYIRFRVEREPGSWTIDSETKYLQYYFLIKHSWMPEKKRLVVIIQDITEIKRRDEEISLKAVAIKEIHHRIKNNLQSIVSLLKIQERRAKHEETKKALQDSVSRILAVASTHELLSQQMENFTTLEQTLQTVVHNFYHIFSNYRDIQICMQVDKAVYLTTDQVLTVSVVVNELLQNVFDHAYELDESGTVLIIGKAVNSMIDIVVQDDGKGFSVEAVNGDSLGLLIIRSYIKDKLKGKLNIKSDTMGTRVNFRFPKSNIGVV